ncbi:hypothetical protein AXF42_Ash013373 [Apostasia shenzhenica]|uniref:Micro-fibrillar-associated protein 1 C-terminal domain-containing protein n=1 Tax=Apostasia shenzhenica TaxID=1088818 RepID=A0A2I0A422_9ASPA|nr:hypothetical protein AXF42_Ash013373 [Apostasia shenzhenica]
MPNAMEKLVYKLKSQWDTILECERVVEKERCCEELQKRRLEERKEETKQFLVEAEKHEVWKFRGLVTIKKEREDKEAWLRKNPNPLHKLKQKRRFLQKDYHKGDFFQFDADDWASTMATDEIYKRDFSAPMWEDKMDKSILPKIMHVKNFGRIGRTRWSDLLDEDTTDRSTP